MDSRSSNSNTNHPPNIKGLQGHKPSPQHSKSPHTAGQKRPKPDDEPSTPKAPGHKVRHLPDLQDSPTPPSRRLNIDGKDQNRLLANTHSGDFADTIMEDDIYSTPTVSSFRLTPQQLVDNIHCNLNEANELMLQLHSLKSTVLAREHEGIKNSLETLSATLMVESICSRQNQLMSAINSITDTINSMQKTIASNHREVVERIKKLETPPHVAQTPEVTVSSTSTTPTSWASIAKKSRTSTSQSKTTITPTTNPLISGPRSQDTLGTAQTTHQTNPNTSHHPTRLVVQFHPDGILDKDKEDPERIVQVINEALNKNDASSHLKVVAARFNTQGNLILSTRLDQTAAELIQHADRFIPLIDKGYKTTTRVDKRWFKIQVDGISSCKYTIDGARRVRTPEDIHTELAACNPYYNQITISITAPPRWMRTEEELLTTNRSSVVFAVDQESIAKKFLEGRTLAAFGRHCTLRAYQDRPPIVQCKNCWGWDHKMEHCKSKPRCRLCGKDHATNDHQPENCRTCTILTDNGDSMDTDGESNTCYHNLRCVNCVLGGKPDANHAADARQCHTRIEKYGTVREIERKSKSTDNPWTVVSSSKKTARRKSRTSTSIHKPNTTNLNQQNMFSVLDFNAPPEIHTESSSITPSQCSNANSHQTNQ